MLRDFLGDAASRTSRTALAVSGLLLCSGIAAQERVRPVVPPQTATTSPIVSPAVDAGDYVYVSGQGPRNPNGTLPSTFAAQVQQSLDNIKKIVEAAGLTMDHVVYTQVYLGDIGKYEELNKVFAGYFPMVPPARAVLGVASLPEPPVQINAVAVRDLKDLRAVFP